MRTRILAAARSSSIQSVFSTPQTITLGATLELENKTSPEVINGPGAGLVTVSGGGTVGVFFVDTRVTATISGLTISGGSVAGFGSGLDNFGTATLSGCTLSGNSVTGAPYGPSRGGTVFNYNSAKLTLTDCTLSGNSAQSSGGGLENDGTAYLTDCAFSDNYAVDGGGVVNFVGTISLNNCTISGNSANNGGGLLNYFGKASLTDCTLSGNSAVGYGGGVLNLGEAYLTLTACTLSGNSATYAGGLANYYGTATLTRHHRRRQHRSLRPSDITGNENVSGSDNLIGTGGSGGLANGVDGNIVLTSLADLGLAPLGNNGGPTQTMALLPGSSGHRHGCDRRLPRHQHSDHHRPPASRSTHPIRTSALQTQGSTLVALDLLGNQRPEHHLRHLQRDHFRFAGKRLASPSGRDRRRDARRRPAVGHNRLRRRFSTTFDTPASPWPIRPTRSPTRMPATGPSPPPAPPAR